ncbi:MAG: PilT/PilU family type 4a pilus ATPase, partial [Planctomycetes bacterium]|nr:PilT/PilU family type 4a pilus ATPase [Planctomycetota bacterium]
YGLAGVARFRVNFLMQDRGAAAVCRIIPEDIQSLDDLGVPAAVAALADIEKGLVLVTGPTGSGKSTTLAAIIDAINRKHERHIVTIEEPVEFVHKNRKSVISHREVGTHTNSFAAALRAVIRQDADVVLVGEMRDLETIEAAIRAAETGHLVFATLHTTGAAGTINRIIDAFPVNQQAQVRVQLSVALICVLSQVLLRRDDRTGRVAAYEFLVVTPAISNLIRENKTFRIDSAIQTGKKFGMQLLDDHLWSLYQKGVIPADEMIDKGKDPGELTEKVHRAGGSVGRTELDTEPD